MPRKALLWAGVALGVLLLGGGAGYWLLADPAPTSARLLAAAKSAQGAELEQQAQGELCLSNFDYGVPAAHVQEHDQRTRSWLDTLVAAGLYEEPVEVTQQGFFAQTLLRYRATPQLAAWRDGKRLCLGRRVELVDVQDIGEPRKEDLGTRTVPVVAAQLVLRAAEPAPWLAPPEVQAAVLGQASGWSWQDGKLQKQLPFSFGLDQGQWKAGSAFQAELMQQEAAARRASRPTAGQAQADSGGGLLAQVRQWFSFGGHPLEGSWRVDTAGMGGLFGGASLPPDISPTLTFTKTSMKMGAHSVECKFEVDGQRVTVTPQGQGEGIVLQLQDKDSFVMDMGLITIPYRRVR